jgi:hypothetical protein
VLIEELTLSIVLTCLPEIGGGRSIQSSLLAVILASSSVLSIFCDRVDTRL